jgi:hypothetical protein
MRPSFLDFTHGEKLAILAGFNAGLSMVRYMRGTPDRPFILMGLGSAFTFPHDSHMAAISVHEMRDFPDVDWPGMIREFAADVKA